MDKDFDKLQEFVEIMKVSIDRVPSTGQHCSRVCGKEMPDHTPNSIAGKNEHVSDGLIDNRGSVNAEFRAQEGMWAGGTRQVLTERGSPQVSLEDCLEA